MYFVFKNNASNATTPSVEIFKDGASVGTTTLQSWSNWNSTSIGKLSEGSYTYNLKHNGKVICTHSINVKSPLSCSVDKTTIGLGESFKFTTNYAGSAWGHSLSGNGAPASTGGSAIYTITPTAIGTHTYTFSVTSGDKGSAECSYSVIVEEVPPTITCPADLTGIALNSNITVTPLSLTGCTNGCNYTIEGTSATGSGYTGGEVSFTGESAAGEKTYTWNVSNSKGSDDCEFKVTYDASAPVCHCEDDCGAGCENNVMTGNIGDVAFNGCLFITDATRLSFNTDNGGYWKVNGSTIDQKQPCWDNSGACSEFLNNYPKVDGGWYIQGNVGWASVHTSSAINPCAGGGSGGGGSEPISVGTCSDAEIRKNDYQTNVWYSLDVGKNGYLVMQDHSGKESSLTYKDCSGSEQTKLIKTGQNGDAGSGWWNSLGNVSNGCKIVFKFSSGGDFAIQIW